MKNSNKKKYADIGKRIKSRMKKLGFSQVDIATMTGASSGAISLWVNGASKPQERYLNLLAEVLETETDWLLGGDAAIKKPEPETKEESVDEATDDEPQVNADSANVIETTTSAEEHNTNTEEPKQDASDQDTTDQDGDDAYADSKEFADMVRDSFDPSQSGGFFINKAGQRISRSEIEGRSFLDMVEELLGGDDDEDPLIQGNTIALSHNDLKKIQMRLQAGEGFNPNELNNSAVEIDHDDNDSFSDIIKKICEHVRQTNESDRAAKEGLGWGCACDNDSELGDMWAARADGVIGSFDDIREVLSAVQAGEGIKVKVAGVDIGCCHNNAHDACSDEVSEEFERDVMNFRNAIQSAIKAAKKAKRKQDKKAAKKARKAAERKLAKKAAKAERKSKKKGVKKGDVSVVQGVPTKAGKPLTITITINQ